jgi:hypothetical protein
MTRKLSVSFVRFSCAASSAARACWSGVDPHRALRLDNPTCAAGIPAGENKVIGTRSTGVVTVVQGRIIGRV